MPDKIKVLLTTIIAAVCYLLIVCIMFVALWLGNFMIILGILLISNATNPFFPAVIIGLLITISIIKKERKSK